MTTHPYLHKKAQEAYDAVAAANDGKISSLEDVLVEMERTATNYDIDKVKRQAFMAEIQSVDRVKIAQAGAMQLTLLGDLSALNGFLPTGTGSRVRLRFATWDDLIADLDLERRNLDAVDAKFRSKNEHVLMIAPYLSGTRKTYEVAVTNYLKDHPISGNVDDDLSDAAD